MSFIWVDENSRIPFSQSVCLYRRAPLIYLGTLIHII